jgi:hypothetical protein
MTAVSELVSVREMYKSALAHGLVGEETMAALFVMGEVPDPGVSERRVVRFAVRPRHVLRAEERVTWIRLLGRSSTR